MSQIGVTQFFGGTIGLAELMQEAPAAADAANDQTVVAADAWRGTVDEDTIIVAGGGSAGEVAVALQVAAALDGRRFPLVLFDTDWRERERERLPDGREVGIGRTELVALAQDTSLLDELERSAGLKRAFRGPNGLFRGVTALEQYDQLGYGSGGLRSVALLAYLASQGSGQLEGRLRRVLRLSAMPVAKRGSFWDAEDIPVEEPGLAPRRRRRIVVIGGGSGSAGAAGLVALPPFIRRVAKKLWPAGQEPVLYGVVLGPRVYSGLTPRTLVNWAATVEDLEQGCTNGTTLSLADGSVLRDPQPVYRRVFAFDDPQATEALEQVGGQEGERVVPEEVRRRFHRAVGRTLYQALSSDALEQFEGVAINGGGVRRAWGTMLGAESDLVTEQVRVAVAAERTARRLEAAARG